MQPEIETLEPRPYVGVRTELRMQEIGDRIGELMPTVMGAAGEAIAGPPFARWHAWDEAAGTGVMELGVPVARALTPDAPAAADELPGGRAAVYWHIGPYEQLVHSWKIVDAWVKAQGLTGRGAPWEEYCSDCDVTPPAELRTRIVMPVE